MNTNFFTTLASLNTKAGWKINIINTPDNKFVVSILLFDDKLDDKAPKQMQPLQLTGTAEELNEGFFKHIEMPVKTTDGLFSNAAKYMQSLEETKKNTQQEKDKKGKEKKTEEPKGKTFESEMKKVEELEAQGKFAEALLKMPKAEDYPDNEEEIEEKREGLWAKKDEKENNLFK